MGALIRWGVIALAAVTAAAQVHENVTVELIEVPVYVFGPDGKPVRGLTKDKFELRVNRRPQPIEYFDAMDFGAATPTSTPSPQPRTQRERRLYLLLFDQLYSIPTRLQRAQRAAEYVVNHSNQATDLFAVATYTPNHGLQFSTPFLSDRIAIRRAIGTLTASTASDPFHVALSAAEKMTYDQKDDDLLLLPPGRQGDETQETIRGGAANQEALAQPAKQLIEDQLANYADLAQRLSRLEGQKHVLLFSEGFDSTKIHGGDHPVPTSYLSGGGLDARSFRILDETFKKFRSAGVFLDAIDIAGLHHDPLKPYDNDSLQFLAHGTGGEFVNNRNDFAQAVSELTQSEQVVYVLAFNRRDALAGSIDVRVHGIPHGSRVSFRQGFGKAERTKDVDPLQLADILLNDVPQSGFNLRLSASASDLLIELRRDEIVPQLVDATPDVETILYVFDNNGTAVFGGEKTIGFTQLDRQRKDPILLRRHVDLPPGHYVAKAIARIAGTTSLGFARTEFTVP